MECGLCGGPVIVQVRGRMPKWCSSTCRTRASERRRAAADGLAAVKVVDRDVERIKTVTVVQHHTRHVEVEAVRWPTATSEWLTAIRDLTRHVETGRVYDRDLKSLGGAVNDLIAAVARPPIRVCPSAPIFQKRIRNAGVIATAMHRSTSASRIVTHRRRLLPTAPEMMPE